MAQILVRDLDDALVARLKERARQNHRAGGAQATAGEVEEILEGWRRYWGGWRFSDSADLIREDREVIF